MSAKRHNRLRPAGRKFGNRHFDDNGLSVFGRGRHCLRRGACCLCTDLVNGPDLDGAGRAALILDMHFQLVIPFHAPLDIAHADFLNNGRKNRRPLNTAQAIQPAKLRQLVKG